MILLYRKGTSIIHRMRPGLKVLVLALLALALSITSASIISLPVAGMLAVALYLVAGLGLSTLVQQILAVRWVIVIMLVSQVLFLSVPVAIANTGRVVVVLLFAALITLTTRIPDLLDATERTLAPLRRFGVNPASIGLLLALTITAIPVITGFATAIRDAQRARGVQVRLHSVAVPLLIMSLKHSDELADALTARGIE